MLRVDIYEKYYDLLYNFLIKENVESPEKWRSCEIFIFFSAKCCQFKNCSYFCVRKCGLAFLLLHGMLIIF
jgi:hypothetical protein